jgi:hypothetical protein
MVRLPADEGQLRSMVAQGLLDEGHTLELKRELPPGTAANKELARDLGQFTIDGGVLAIGVDEGDETTPPSLTPVEFADLPERIEQVAANRVDPPLHVRIQTILAAGQPGKGYLLVIVPPTPSKIHMVDGRYWARGKKTRYPLSDPEVQRYHQLVLKGQRDATDLLHVEVRRDPAAAAGRRPTPTCSGSPNRWVPAGTCWSGSSAGQGRGAGMTSSMARCAAGRRAGRSPLAGRRTSRGPAIRLDGRQVGRCGRQG